MRKKSKKENSTEAKSCHIKCCGKTVLIVIAALVALRLFFLFGMPASYRIVGTPATVASVCPTTDNLKGEGSFQAGPEKTQAAALASATALMQGRADIEAGLAMNKYTCPNPACQTKKLGRVVAVPQQGYPTATRVSFWSFAADAFDLFTSIYWSGDMKYFWQARVTCS